ncbi:MAG: adenylyl-sulfate kinase [Myxococcales bacterium]|nr:adenylyl-sulfate kinase [Myxococcales bacterium]
MTKHGRLILLMGISGSGKTTLGRMLTARLRQRAAPVCFIDGDVVRGFFGDDLGFSAAERNQATRRMAFGAFTVVELGIDVVMANIAGSSQTRAFLRSKFPRYIEVFCSVDFATAGRHDVKGVYRRAMALEDPQLVGHDVDFDEPTDPSVVVHPYQEPPEESLERILAFLDTESSARPHGDDA